ncbi:DivIVA domain-containing protein [Actinopolymorpha alba]|uniref:DivIVA domain-containing protein n=1 Tax=Actinopolymorpha alba TaxID=533267 RepID=UPI000376C2C7|nr:DivIVA domain-containing protein [Actinopolymorpha alba]
MAWLWLVLVVAVLGLTAAVAVGRGGGLERAYPDRHDIRLPSGRPIIASDVDGVAFSVVLRGYRMDEVDEVIRRLVYEIAGRDARLNELEGELRGHRPAHPHPPSAVPPEVRAPLPHNRRDPLWPPADSR